MQDINGSYDVYNATDPRAEQLNIVRNKEIRLDRQHLDNPMLSLGHKFKYAMRGSASSYSEYAGYNGEDLRDEFRCGTVGGEISRIEIKGSGGLVRTLIDCYSDDYCNA